MYFTSQVYNNPVVQKTSDMKSNYIFHIPKKYEKFGFSYAL